MFISVGSRGDVLPLFSLAQEMKRRGHDATLVADNGYGAAARSLGIEYVELLTQDEHRAALQDKWLLNTRYISLSFSRHAVTWNRRILDAILERADANLVVIAADRPNLWADYAAHAQSRARFVRAAIDPTPAQRLTLNPPTLPATRVQVALEPSWRVDWAMNTTGNRRLSHLSRKSNSSRNSIPRIGLWPDWLTSTNDRPSSIPKDRLFGFMPLPEIASASDDSEHIRKDLVFLCGTDGTHTGWTQTFFNVSNQVCSELGMSGLVLGGHVGEYSSGRLEDLVTVRPFVSLSMALRSAHVVIHHGGIGTAATAFELGVPQLIVPRFFAQPSNAEWVQRQVPSGETGADCYMIAQDCYMTNYCS